jgi:methylenetetrahydrofolate reductase (NADPH)
VDKALSFARQAAKDGLLDALSITDNPGGNPSLSPDALGREIKQMGIDPVVHFACRDWNRYGAYSRALQLDRLGIENLLVVTGDYPQEGAEGTAKPCFDLDSVTMMCMLDGMSRGDDTFCCKGPGDHGEKTGFLLGAAVSCFKYAESEVINQYYKLLKKVRNGASFAITQLCYDARKFDELLRFMRGIDCNIPVMGSVCILSERSTRAMNCGAVPGAFVTDDLLRQIELESDFDDKGKEASLMRSAKLMAILKGLGYRGAHIIGTPNYDDVRMLIDNFRQMQGQWQDFLVEFDYPYAGGFYLYERDQETGLNTPEFSQKSRRSAFSWTQQAFMRTVHALLFDKDARHYPVLKRLAKSADTRSLPKAGVILIENMIKSVMFGCRKCGDCALAEMAYLCPESQCPKFLRNGACGGSDKGRCEVRKEALCVWVRIYERLKSHKRSEELKCRCVRPRNWALDGTSSWLNFYMDRDYQAFSMPLCERMKKPPFASDTT